MNTIADRVRQCRMDKGWVQADLATAAGVSQSTIGNIEAGIRDGKQSLYAIAEALGVSYKWLSEGVGQKLVLRDAPGTYAISSPKSGTNRQSENQLTHVTSLQRIPVIDWGEAIGFNTGMYQEPGRRMEFVPGESLGNSCAILIVENDVMLSNRPEESFPPGTMIVVEFGAHAKPGQFVVARHPATGEPTFRQLTADAGRWFLRATNPAYQAIELPDMAEAIMGVVRRSMTVRTLA